MYKPIRIIKLIWIADSPSTIKNNNSNVKNVDIDICNLDCVDINGEDNENCKFNNISDRGNVNIKGNKNSNMKNIGNVTTTTTNYYPKQHQT